MGYSQLQQQNVSAAAAYTEYSIVVPAMSKQVTLSLRPSATPANIFWYTAPSGSSSPGSSANLPALYGTIPIGSNRTIFGVLGGQTIYFQVDQSGQTLEADYYADN
jgi:hypothetical protein